MNKRRTTNPYKPGTAGKRRDGPAMTNELRKGDDIADRLLFFSVRIVDLALSLPSKDTWRHIANQLVRSATSVGANYEEARGSETRTDFIYKLSLAKKEMRESLYWLKLLNRTYVSDMVLSDKLLKEANSLISILAKSVKTARENSKKKGKKR